MQKGDKKKLRKILDELHDCGQELEQLRDRMQERVDKLRERYDNMSERAQESDKGQSLEQEISDDDDTISSIEEIMNNLAYAEDARPSENEE